MKTFVFVLALALIAVAVGEEKSKVDDKQLAKLQEYQQECLNETHGDSKILEKIQKGNFKADEPKIKETILCFFKKIKFFDQSGQHRHQFILQKVSQVLGIATNSDFVKDCLVQKDKPDETAVEMWQCIYKECENDMDKLNEIFAKGL